MQWNNSLKFTKWFFHIALQSFFENLIYDKLFHVIENWKGRFICYFFSAGVLAQQ